MDDSIWYDRSLAPSTGFPSSTVVTYSIRPLKYYITVLPTKITPNEPISKNLFEFCGKRVPVLEVDVWSEKNE